MRRIECVSVMNLLKLNLSWVSSQNDLPPVPPSHPPFPVATQLPTKQTEPVPILPFLSSILFYAFWFRWHSAQKRRKTSVIFTSGYGEMGN